MMAPKYVYNVVLSLNLLSISISATHLEEKVCLGTNSGLSTSYGICRSLYDRYINCTLVLGNLELVFSDCPDFSFLQNIREVTGHVLIKGMYNRLA